MLRNLRMQQPDFSGKFSPDNGYVIENGGRAFQDLLILNDGMDVVLQCTGDWTAPFPGPPFRIQHPNPASPPPVHLYNRKVWPVCPV